MPIFHFSYQIFISSMLHLKFFFIHFPGHSFSSFRIFLSCSKCLSIFFRLQVSSLLSFFSYPFPLSLLPSYVPQSQLEVCSACNFVWFYHKIIISNTIFCPLTFSFALFLSFCLHLSKPNYINVLAFISPLYV